MYLIIKQVVPKERFCSGRPLRFEPGDLLNRNKMSLLHGTTVRLLFNLKSKCYEHRVFKVNLSENEVVNGIILLI